MPSWCFKGTVLLTHRIVAAPLTGGSNSSNGKSTSTGFSGTTKSYYNEINQKTKNSAAIIAKQTNKQIAAEANPAVQSIDEQVKVISREYFKKTETTPIPMESTNLDGPCTPCPGPGPDATYSKSSKSIQQYNQLQNVSPTRILPPDRKVGELPKGYTWYDSEREAIDAWSRTYRSQSEEYEHCTFIFCYLDDNFEHHYTYGKTGVGSLAIPQLGIRANVIGSFLSGYLFESVSESSIVGFVHTHPNPPKGYTSSFASEEDLFLLNLPRIDFVVVVPYENEKIIYYYNDGKEEWE